MGTLCTHVVASMRLQLMIKVLSDAPPHAKFSRFHLVAQAVPQIQRHAVLQDGPPFRASAQTPALSD